MSALGITTTIIATMLVDASVKDDTDGGYDISAGLFGPAQSDAIREIAGQLDALRLEVAAKQARIDELMLEYCPDEMTEEQVATYTEHQKPVQS